ncbi:glycosyltransferase family 2 protein [Thetidibacter halocola]|uniref:Glycosyltransferase family 2 protein n=1 Tax=Thetidibacter halocola TaxID=2827239 RepID=A0A8J7WB67_9RHOB|nr:glycosyltransferase family 2 protein [Thetidibacter halocola]MBS0124312.1 glycosyltransferase family 2 protein [Thetidibacter halocola]
MTHWGIVSTIRAPLPEILDFAAWHLEQGAERLFLYLDEDDPAALAVLNAHPRITARHTDADWWARRKGRPEMHQARQGLNARHANNSAKGVDWLAHIDVDEFLIPATPIADQLAALPPACLCARVRPIEALAPGDAADPGETLFKAFHLHAPDRQRAAELCFPRWGAELSGGFLSHVAGKVFFRAGTQGLQIRIHNVFLDGVENPGIMELPGIELGHFHAADWDHFRDRLTFRLQRGSYRAELKPQVRRPGALSHHDLLAGILADGGEPALRAFFDAVCVASRPLCDRLAAAGLLRRHRMDLPTLRRKHFGPP